MAIQETIIPLRTPLFRGEKRLRIALVGLPNSGKSTLFRAVSSTSVQTGELAGTHRAYSECAVQIGLDEARLVLLPGVGMLSHASYDDRITLQYLLWGDERPPVSVHEPGGPPAPFAPPDVIIQVVDSTALERHLELTLQLTQLGRPLVIALNMADQAWEKGLHIHAERLGQRLGVRVVSTSALKGHGLSELFSTAVEAVRDKQVPLPQLPSGHIGRVLEPLKQVLSKPELQAAFRVPEPFLLSQIAANDGYFMSEVGQHFPALLPELIALRKSAEAELPRPLDEELHADRHHQAATLFEAVSRIGAPHEGRSWRDWLDALFLNPYWGLLGSLAVFAVILFVVFQVSAWLDSLTAAKLIAAVADWHPETTQDVVLRAVVDGLIGLVGIVVPYMIPLVLLLVALEESGLMQRIAFVIDRGFHHVGLHGAVAVSFLLGLGCNVPAISAAARAATGRERVIASLLITFVPCSARSAIILALAGKYLGGLGVLGIFALTLIIIALLGRVLANRFPESGPGQVQEIPPYRLPRLRSLLLTTWSRTSDVLTIVTPLLVGGSIVLALLDHYQASALINTALLPITDWWLGLPVLLGVPILFGILRKELSLLMVYQALGGFEIDSQLNAGQIVTFLVFLTFYFPCVSTFAIMLKTIGRKQALFSVALSVGVALLVSGAVRWAIAAWEQVSPLLA
ncbi:ferrous iron transporter B [Methylococcus sp. EFPC2]|uniref:ferrous iron transporter B n=1 Tax=Methylococcus sp. EFPC2 TaxID=2812648 RepID=UPI0019682598|nr:ferrous iron transporter B [Methylococcus sp. EFPC2]QSA97309.1 ferrous iron transporter B [Methylococcus sp. EFPC2]